MKLYLFSISNYSGKPHLSVREYEVEEKPKTYTCNNRRFNKSDLGKISGYFNDECFLFENNPSQAVEIFLAEQRRQMEELQSKVSKKQAVIDMLENFKGEES